MRYVSKLKTNVLQIFRIIRAIGKLMLRRLSDPYYEGKSAEIAFFIFMSILPILGIFTQLLGLFNLTADQLREFAGISLMYDGEVGSMLSDLMNQAPSGMSTVVMFSIALWGASKLEFTMAHVANYTLTDAEHSGKGYIKERFRAIICTVLTIGAIVISMVVMVYGRSLFILITGIYFDMLIPKTWLLALRWPLFLGFLFLMISFALYLLPSKRVKLRDIVPGSTFMTIGAMTVTVGFNLYTKYIADYNVLYGSFAGIIAMMIYFWLLAWVMLSGIIFMRSIWQIRKYTDMTTSSDNDRVIFY